MSQFTHFKCFEETEASFLFNYISLLFETGKATKHDQIEILKYSVNPILF